MASLDYLWKAFDLHWKLFSYVPYRKLLQWDSKRRTIYHPSKFTRKLVPWYLAIFGTIITLGLVTSFIVLVGQIWGRRLPNLLIIVQSLAIGVFSMISGGTGIVTILYQEEICHFFARLVEIDSIHVRKKTRRKGPQNGKLKQSIRYTISQSSWLEIFVNLLIVSAAAFPIPMTTLAIFENLEPFGHFLELYILPDPTQRSIVVIWLSLLIRLVMGYIAVIETTRTASFLILVFVTVTQIYLKILTQAIRFPWLSSSLRNFIMLQMIHEAAKAPGNSLVSLLMTSGVALNVLAFWIVVNCWGKVVWVVYIIALAASVGVPVCVVALMPFAVHIHEKSQEIIRRWMTWNRQSEGIFGRTRNIKWRKLRVRALNGIYFSCGNLFRLKHSSKIEYLQVSVERIIDTVLGIPAP